MDRFGEVLVDNNSYNDELNGGRVFFQVKAENAGTDTQTLTIRNTGDAPLTGIAAQLTGSNAGHYSLDTTGMLTSLNALESTSFKVTFAPTATGDLFGQLEISSSDSDENPFNLVLSGQGITLPATTLLVDSASTNQDRDFGPGELTLTEALRLADAAPDLTTITFARSLDEVPLIAGTDTFARFSVGSAVNIVGNGAPATILDGNNSRQVLAFFNGNGATYNATISGVTIRNGNITSDGAGIQNGANLTIIDSAITNNRTTSRGGGISNFGNLTIIGSTISGNTASNGGGTGDGGAIAHQNGTLNISNSTISGNAADRIGGLSTLNPATILNSTIVANTATAGGGLAGGIYNTNSTLTLHNTIVAGNTSSGTASDVVIASGSMAAESSSNLIGDPATAGGLVHGTNGNILGDGSGNPLALSSIVNSLGNNGGFTLTHTLAAGSPALDAGNNTAASSLSTDQRGAAPRANGVRVDIGSVETAATVPPEEIVVESPFGTGLVDGSSSVQFHLAAVGGSSQRTFTIRNEGSLDLTGIVITLEGADDADFVVNTTGMRTTLTPATHTTFAIDFDPATIGSKTVTLHIASNAAGSPFDIELNGTAIDPPAIDLIVDTAGDVDNGNFDVGDLTFREAVVLANLLDDANVIQFAAGLDGAPILLTGALETISRPVTIDGNGASATIIDAQQTTRVFNIDDGNGGSQIAVTLSDLTIQNGLSGPRQNGGGIANNENLSVLRSAILSNRAQGPDDDGAPFGGGIVSFGTLLIEDSTIAGNSSDSIGGGVFVAGTATLRNTTISGNSALANGGLGVASLGPSPASASLLNCTIVGNTGSAAPFGAPFGGILSYGAALSMQNTIVAGNVENGLNSDVVLVSGGSFTTAENNLIGDPSSSATITHGTDGNIVGDGAGGLLPLSSIVGGLLDNGGPTLTHAPASGSPAIDAGSDAAAASLMADQRGFTPRIVGSAVDIGSVEVGATDSTPTTTIATASLSADTGTSSTDFITRTATQTISGTLSANLAIGEIVQVSLNNGVSFTTATASVGQNTWSIGPVTLTGSNTLIVRVSDSGGKNGPAFTQAYVLDTTAPTNTIATASLSADTGTSSSDFVTRTAAQTLSGTLNANLATGEIVQVSLNNGTSFTTATTTVGQKSWSLAGQTLTGSNTLLVRVTDTAGNTGTAFSQAYVLDTTAPTTSIATAGLSADTGVSSSDFITHAAAQTLSGTLSANVASGEVVQVSLDNGVTFTAATAAVGQNTWSLGSLTLTGSDTLIVRVSDAAGNTGPAFTQDYVLDTDSPTNSIATASLSADTGASSSDFITRTAAQTISGTLAANLASGDIVEVSLDNGSTFTTATATVGQNTWSLASQTLAGSNTLVVRISDTAGNAGSLFTQSYVLDTTAPTTTIATASLSADTGTSSSDFVTSTAAQTLSGTLSANLASGEVVQVSLNNGVSFTTATTTVGQNTWSLASQTLSGSNTLVVRVSDTAGNTSTAFTQAYVLDATDPSTTIATASLSADTGTSSSDFITRTAAQTISGTLSANLASGEFVELSLDNGASFTDATATVGQDTWSLASQTLSGSNTLVVRVADAAGNTGPEFTQAYVLDTTAPTTTIATASLSADTGVSNSDFITRTAAQTISGTLSANLAAGQVVQVSLDSGGTFSNATAAAEQNIWSLASQTLTGSNTLVVRVADTAGNAGSLFTQSYVLDTAAPTTTIATASLSADTGTSSSDFVTSTAAQTLSGTLSANLASGEIVEVSLDNGATFTTATTTVGQNTWSLASQTLTGSNTIVVRVADTAGNTSTAFTQAYVLDATDPSTTIATVSLSADTGVSSSDFITRTAAQTITGTLSANLASGEFVELSLDNGASFTDATATVGQDTWSLASQTLSGSNTLVVRVADAAGNTGTEFTQAYILDTTAPTITIATASLSADTGVSSGDFITRTAAQSISGTLAANLASGEFVQVSLNNGVSFTTATTTVGQNTWSLASQTLTGSNTLVVRVSDTAGNAGSLFTQSYVLDTTASTNTIATASLSADTGSSDSDFITSTAAQTLSGTLSANLASGEFVQVSLNNGTTFTTATTTVGQNTWSLASQTLTGSNTLVVRVADTAGNTATAFTQAYVLDATDPSTTIAMASLSADTGTSSSDFITRTAAQTISGTLSANLASGEFVEVSLDNGASFTNATATVGQDTWSLASQTLSGSNTLVVRVSDAAGNTGKEFTQAYILDTTAPTITIATASLSADTGISSGDFITRTAAQTISGTLAANLAGGEFVQVSLNNGVSFATAKTTVGQNTWSLASQTLTGSNTLVVRVSDTAGNAGSLFTQSYVLDTTAPTTMIATASLSADTGSSDSDFITSTAAQTLSGTLSANLASGEFVQVSLNNGVSFTTATTTVGQNTWSLASQTLTGRNTLIVRVSDTAGNTSTAFTQAYVFDATDPSTTIATVSLSADTGVSNSDFITRTAAQTISGTLSANLASGEFVEVSLDNGASFTDATATVGQDTWSLASQTLSGSNTLVVRVADAAGNTGPEFTQAYVLDTTAPTITIATASLSADTGVSNSDFVTRTAAQTISGTLSANLAAGQVVQVSLDSGGTFSNATAAAGQNTWSLAFQTLTGSNTLIVRVSDTAGNTSTAFTQAYVLDATDPSTTIAMASLSADTGTSNSDFITRTAAQTISGTLSANLASGEFVEVSLDNGASFTDATATVGQDFWSLASQTLSGSNTLVVRVSDASGNTGPEFTQAYVLDTTAPTTTIATASLSADTGVSNSDFITRTAAQTISGTLSANLAAGQVVQVSLDSGGTFSNATAAAGQNTWSLASQTLTGSNTLVVRVFDAAGNTGTEFTRSYVLDTTAPTTTIATAGLSADSGTSSSDFITRTAAQTVSGTLNANLASGERVEVSLNNGVSYATATAAAGQNTWSLAGQTLAGSNTLIVRVADAAGNLGTSFTRAYVLDTTAPSTTVSTASLSADTGASSSDFITRTAAQTLSGTLSVNLAIGESVQVSLDNGATFKTATAAVGQNTWSLGGQTLTGSSTLIARIADVAGNVGPAFTLAFILDTNAPTKTVATAKFSADTGTSTSDFITRTAAQTLSGTLSANLSAGEVVQVSLDNGTTFKLATAGAGQKNWSLGSQTLTASSTLIVRVADAAGNIGPVFTRPYVLDETAPTNTIATAKLSADTGTSSSDFITRTAAQTISGTLSANLSTGEVVQVSLDNGATFKTATAAVGQKNWSLGGQTLTGSSTLIVRVGDAAGNTGPAFTHAYVLDTTAPTNTVATAEFSADTGALSIDFITRTAAQNVSGTLSANLTAGQIVQVSLDNSATFKTATAAVGQKTWSLGGQTLTGSSTLIVRVADVAGNTGPAFTRAYILDNTAPTNTVSTVKLSTDSGISESDFITRIAAQNISGTLSENLAAGEIVQVSLDNGATFKTASATAGQKSWSLGSQTLAGSQTLLVRVADQSGNIGPALTRSSVLDSVTPTITSITRGVPAAPVTDANQVSFLVKFSEKVSGVDAIVSRNFGLTGTATAGAVLGTPTSVDGGLTWSIPVNGLGGVNGTLQLNLIRNTGIADAAGNGLSTATFSGPSYTLNGVTGNDQTSMQVTIRAEDISSATSGTVTFTATLADNSAVDVSTLKTGNVVVTGPGGFSQVAQFVSVDENSNGSPRVATYALTQPAGGWLKGSYAIGLGSSLPADTSGNTLDAEHLAAGTTPVFAFTTPITVPARASSVKVEVQGSNFVLLNADTGAVIGTQSTGLPISINGPGGSSTLDLDLSALPASSNPVIHYHVPDGGTNSVQLKLTGAANVTPTFKFSGGAGGTNTLHVDSTSLPPNASANIVFEGEADSENTIDLSAKLGNQTFNGSIYEYTGAHDGSLTLGNGTGLIKIVYSNLTPLLNAAVASNATFNLQAGSAAEFGSSGTSTSNLISLNGTFEGTTFANPRGAITLNVGSGGFLRVTGIPSSASSSTFHATGDNVVFLTQPSSKPRKFTAPQNSTGQVLYVDVTRAVNPQFAATGVESGRYTSANQGTVTWSNFDDVVAITRLYRAYNSDVGLHFYTASQFEFDDLIDLGLNDESTGQDGFAVLQQSVNGAAPVMRFYNPNGGQHYYTMSEFESESLVRAGWTKEGSPGFMYSTQQPGTTEIFHIYNTVTGEHLFTESPGYFQALHAMVPEWVLQNSLGFSFAVSAANLPGPSTSLAQIRAADLSSGEMALVGANDTESAESTSGSAPIALPPLSIEASHVVTGTTAGFSDTSTPTDARDTVQIATFDDYWTELSSSLEAGNESAWNWLV